MPTQQPTSAPDAIGSDAAEQDTAAAVLHDDALDQTPGGGGLRGPAGADPLTARTAGGATRNSPIDTGVAAPDADGAAVAESRVQAAEDTPAEPHPSSQ